MSVAVIIEQTLIIFGYVFLGWILCRCKIAGPVQAQFLSRMITGMTLPLSILASSSIETRQEDLVHMLLVTLLLTTLLLVSLWGTFFVTGLLHFSTEKRAAFTSLCAFPNVGFMGIPLCVALMGEWGSLYGAAAVIAFNLVFFTCQVSLFQPQVRFSPKSLITLLNGSVVVAVIMMIARLRFPSPVQTLCSNVGNMTTPLALIVVGILLGTSKLREVFQEKLGYVAVLMRNLLWPLAMLAVLAALPLDRTMRLALMVFTVTPCANLTAVYGAQYHMEPQLCSRTVLLSTLLSIITMPPLLTLAERVF